MAYQYHLIIALLTTAKMAMKILTPADVPPWD